MRSSSRIEEEPHAARTAALDNNEARGKQRGRRSASDSWGSYLREIGSIPLLRPQEETKLAGELHSAREALVALARQLNSKGLGGSSGRTEKGDSLTATTRSIGDLEQYLDNALAHVRREGRRDVRRLVERVRCERRRLERARNALINANLRLVVHVAKKYRNHGLPLADLVQEGNIGLMKAVEKFEHERGHRFSTYAYWWIRQSVVRAIFDGSRTIRLPVHVGETLKKVERVRRGWLEAHGNEPAAAEIAEAANMKVSQVKTALESPRDVRSVEDFGSEDKESNLLAFVADPKAVCPIDRMEQRELKSRIERALQGLDSREASIVRLRYGLSSDREHTLADIGRKLDLSRERVRQIGRRAIRKLISQEGTRELARRYGEGSPPEA